MTAHTLDPELRAILAYSAGALFLAAVLLEHPDEPQAEIGARLKRLSAQLARAAGVELSDELDPDQSDTPADTATDRGASL